MKLRFSQLLCVVILAGAFLVISDGYAQTKTGRPRTMAPSWRGYQPPAASPSTLTASRRHTGRCRSVPS